MYCLRINPVFLGLVTVAEAPVIPARFDVLADYNFSKVLLHCRFFLPDISDVMSVFMWN